MDVKTMFCACAKLHTCNKIWSDMVLRYNNGDKYSIVYVFALARGPHVSLLYSAPWVENLTQDLYIDLTRADLDLKKAIQWRV